MRGETPQESRRNNSKWAPLSSCSASTSLGTLEKAGKLGVTSGSSLTHRSLMGLERRSQGFQWVAFCSDLPAPQACKESVGRLLSPSTFVLVIAWSFISRFSLRAPRPTWGLAGGPSRSVGRSLSSASHLKASCRRHSHSRPSTSCVKIHSLGLFMDLFTGRFHQNTLKNKPGSSTSAPTGNPCAAPLFILSR